MAQVRGRGVARTRPGLPSAVPLLLPCVAGLWVSWVGLHFGRGLRALHGSRAAVLPCLGLALAALALLAFVRVARGRGRGLPALLRAFFTAFVLGTLAWAAAAPYQELLARLGLALSVASTAPLALATQSTRLWARVLDFVLFQVALLLFVAELGGGFLAARSGSPLLAQAGEEVAAALERWRMAPGALHMGFPADERGAYDRSPPTPEERAASGERLVVVVGDSFSQGVVPLPYHYTKLAEEGLAGVRVYNLGAPGIAPTQYELLVREALELEPELFVIAFFVGNDLGLEVPAAPGFLERWLDGGRRYALSVPRKLLRLRRERARRGGERGVAEVQGARAKRASWDRAALVHDMPWLSDPSLEDPTFSEEAFLELERKRAREWAGGDEQLFAATYRQLERIRRAAAGVPLALLVVPDEAQVEDELWRALLEGLEGAEALERERAQRELVAWCAARTIPCEDLLPRMRALEPGPNGRRHLYHLRDTHWNARGNALAAEGLAELIGRALPPAREGR